MTIEHIEQSEPLEQMAEHLDFHRTDIFFEKKKSSFKPFQKIVDADLLKAGMRFSPEHTQEIFDMVYIPGDWKFLEKYIVLKNLIESEGYFVTQKDMKSPGFRILTTQEMAEYAKKKLLKNTISNFKVGYVLAAHEGKEVLSEEERKRLLVTQKAAARMALNSQADLLKSFSV